MESVNLIVYGTLMRGEHNSPFCRNATFVSYCDIFPAFVPDGRGVVKAEFVVLPVADWPAIDRLENHPHLYTRRQIEARLPDGSSEVGWVYVMNTLPAGAKVMEGREWKARE
jgi:gamma-glutamylcyclotransferase (GGCT)/AIG2-like uncharacterized protein YtfP